ncbi:hypothetical protein [Lacticaseibacillus paracasei]|uniref:hypothetical protein n=1 Tax=Lacticaseibacillus paracasei TaxID=1597 RepID=UPI000C75BFA6|nr:hypothetical protein [Lacticaseibacillus paracasei]MBS4971263.1 hypothetical protein [Lacticaseibacillus rhamnosus]RWZ65723.1 hypothetical protein EQK34_05145 [Lacticaseibacillus paracasei]
MKISKLCVACKHQRQINPPLATAEVTDQPYLEFSCPLGHKYSYVTEDPLYEMIYDHALDAYEDENYFECYLSAVTTLERFRTDFIKAFAWEKNGEKSLDNDFKKSQAIRTSERSAGAFSAIGLVEFGDEAVPYINNMYTELQKRNAVIHGETMPNKETCKAMLEVVFRTVIYFNVKSINEKGNSPVARKQIMTSEKFFEGHSEITSYGSRLYTISSIRFNESDLRILPTYSLAKILSWHDTHTRL